MLGFTFYYHRHHNAPADVIAFCGSIRLVLNIIDAGLRIDHGQSQHLEFLAPKKLAALALEAGRFHRRSKVVQ